MSRQLPREKLRPRYVIRNTVSKTSAGILLGAQMPRMSAVFVVVF